MQFRILGPLEVLDGDGAIPLGRGRRRALLALLILHANDVLTTERIADELWDGKPPPSAAKIVQKYVLELRRTIGPDRLETMVGGYVLRVADDELDASMFERLLATGREQRDADVLEDAIAVWRGPALADLSYERFAQTEIARLEELRADAMEERLEVRLANGGGRELVGELQALVTAHPLRERPRFLLMRALYRAGRQSEALEVYRQTRRMLAEELGLEPSSRLRELERAILAQDPELDAVEPPAPAAAYRPRARRPRFVLAVAAVAAVAAGVATPLLVHGASRHRDLIRPNSVASVSPVTGRVAADVAVGREPSALAFGDGAVWVGNRADQTISRIDLPTRRVTTIGVGTDIRALATGFGALWIAGGSDRTLTKVDLLTGAVQATFTPSASGGAVTAVTTGLGSVWATTADGELLRVDPWHDVLLRRIRVPAPATGIAVAGDALYVTGGGLGSVTTVGRTGLTSSLRTLGPASNPVVTEDGSLWIVAGQQRFLFRGNGYGFDPVDVHGGAHVVGIASAKSDIWVADGSGRLVRLDARTERIVQSIVVRARINAVAARDGVVWLTAGGSNPQ